MSTPTLQQKDWSQLKRSALSTEQVQEQLATLEGWELLAGNAAISKTFRFVNFYETMAFVNALALVAHQQDHHPDLEVGYNRCTVRWSTHSVGGLSLNDFICAARVDGLKP